MNVLSLFDGMSCGQIALQRVGIKVDKYYASEIDKYAQQVSKHNFPNTIYLGDVRNVNVLDKIDFLMGGSPCQSFSFAGKMSGMKTKCNIEIKTLEKYLELKQQGFEFEGQSYLFWEYMRVLKQCREINPNVLFLLENVEMNSKWEATLTKAIGINPIYINSALVSAQNRKRIYWTNIGAQADGFFDELYCKIPQPKDKNLLLESVLEKNVSEKYYISNKMLDGVLRSSKGDSERHIFTENDKAPTIDTRVGSSTHFSPYIVASRGRYNDDKITEQKLEPRNDGKTNCLTSVYKDNLVFQLNTSKESGGQQPYQQNRVYDTDGISPALMAQMSCGSHAILENKSKIRRLTPLECERLQTVPDNYTNVVSDTQRYKMLGNGWTVDVIAHILKFL